MLLRREADTRLLSRILLCLLTPYTNSRFVISWSRISAPYRFRRRTDLGVSQLPRSWSGPTRVRRSRRCGHLLDLVHPPLNAQRHRACQSPAPSNTRWRSGSRHQAGLARGPPAHVRTVVGGWIGQGRGLCHHSGNGVVARRTGDAGPAQGLIRGLSHSRSGTVTTGLLRGPVQVPDLLRGRGGQLGCDVQQAHAADLILIRTDWIRHNDPPNLTSQALTSQALLPRAGNRVPARSDH